jgi:hypothetical protein
VTPKTNRHPFERLILNISWIALGFCPDFAITCKGPVQLTTEILMNFPRRFALVLAPFALLTSQPAANAATAVYDFNTNGSGWTSTMVVAFDNPWTFAANVGTGGTGGWSTNGQGPDNGHSNTGLLTSPIMTVQANGTVTLSFDHMYSFEASGGNWDGGQVQVSVNGGSFAPIGTGSFTANGYTGTVIGYGAGGASSAPGQESDLATQQAFVADSTGRATNTFINSIATLGPFTAGNTFSIRFQASSDTNTQGTFQPQWIVDNVSLTNVVPEPGVLSLAGLLGLSMLRRRRR